MTGIPYPENWTIATLDDLIVFALGGDWGKDETYEDSAYVAVRCIRASELRSWNEEKGYTAALRKIKRASLEKRELLEGDILVEISGGGPDQPVGRTVLIDKSVLSQHTDEKKICTNFFRLARPASDVDSKFLNLYLQSFYKSGKISEYQAGSNNLRNLKFNDYMQIAVPLPPPNEQHRIVAKIETLFSELDKGIEALKTGREQLKVYRQAVLKHAFEGKLTARWREENKDKLETPEQLLARMQQERHAHNQQQLQDWQAAVIAWDKNGKQGKKPGRPRELELLPLMAEEENSHLAELPTDWTHFHLGSFVSSIEAGKSFKCDERQPSKNEIGVAKVSAVSWGEYDETESKTCVDPDKVNDDYFIKENDFLLSRANTIELVGACVIARKVTQKVMLSDKTLRVGFCSGNINFFLHYLRSHEGRNEIMKRSTGNQESMRNIGQDRIRSIVVPVCGEEEMSEVVCQVEARVAQIELLNAEIETQLLRSEALRRSILKKAFSGQLVPQDPNDEPASALLERIRAKKTEATQSFHRSPRVTGARNTTNAS